MFDVDLSAVNWRRIQHSSRKGMWKYFDLLALNNPENIVSFGEGGTPLIRLRELEKDLGNVRLYAKFECANPTGTFKDREGSFMTSRCIEMHLNQLVFASSGNTGVSLSTYAGSKGLKTYFFCPTRSLYKVNFAKTSSNFLIAFEGTLDETRDYAKTFAEVNKLQFIAPLHERAEGFTTLAYEQFHELPTADYYVQTVASGLGPIGFYYGSERLVKLGLEDKSSIPKVFGIQISEVNPMFLAWSKNRNQISDEDVKEKLPEKLFESTLTTTRPHQTYPIIYKILKEVGGGIVQVLPSEVEAVSKRLVKAVLKRGCTFDCDVEKSGVIAYAGLKKMADEGFVSSGENVFLVISGGGRICEQLVGEDVTASIQTNPVELINKIKRS
jgi:threonine synthase